MRAEPEEKSIIRDVPASRQDDDPGQGQNNLGSDERRRAGRRSEEPGLRNILRADPLRLEDRLVPDRLQALVGGQTLVDLPPLAGVPHIGEVELAVADVLHPGEG